MRRKKRKNKVNRHIILKIILAVLIILVLILIYLGRSKFWDSKEKLVLVTHRVDNNITVSVFDPVSDNQIDILIPGSVQVQAAGELGTWKLNSLWQLGVNEKMGGDLLVRTIVKNFGFPAVAWRHEDSGRTNLSLGDKTRLFLFQIKIGKNSVSQIDLADTNFLKKARFIDGEWGYTVSGKPPLEVTAAFIDSKLLEGNPRARIINYTNSVSLAERVGAMIEIMGVKVASIEKKESKDFDCNISGSNTRLVEKFDLIFDCDNKSSQESGNFDISLEIGKNFIRRF